MRLRGVVFGSSVGARRSMRGFLRGGSLGPKLSAEPCALLRTGPTELRSLPGSGIVEYGEVLFGNGMPDS